MNARKLSEVLTHHAPHCVPAWLAVHQPSAMRALSGCTLTDTERTEIGALMAGYCNLLEQAGLTHFGDTEEQAVERALERALENNPAQQRAH